MAGRNTDYRCDNCKSHPQITTSDIDGSENFLTIGQTNLLCSFLRSKGKSRSPRPINPGISQRQGREAEWRGLENLLFDIWGPNELLKLENIGDYHP